MSYQNQLKTIKALFGSAVLILLTVFLYSCNSSGEQKAAPNDSTSKALTAPTDLSVPTFKITQADLANQYDNRGITKLIIEVGINNFSNLSNIDLIVYGATNHAEHGRGTPPLQIISREGTTTISSPLILGNNYVNLQTILVTLAGARRDFAYILLTPKNGSGPNRNYLVYNIKAVRTEVRAGKINILSEEDLGDSNPSPPADPHP
jgi:hypothetical protein